MFDSSALKRILAPKLGVAVTLFVLLAACSHDKIQTEDLSDQSNPVSTIGTVDESIKTAAPLDSTATLARGASANTDQAGLTTTSDSTPNSVPASNTDSTSQPVQQAAIAEPLPEIPAAASITPISDDSQTKTAHAKHKSLKHKKHHMVAANGRLKHSRRGHHKPTKVAHHRNRKALPVATHAAVKQAPVQPLQAKTTAPVSAPSTIGSTLDIKDDGSLDSLDSAAMTSGEQKVAPPILLPPPSLPDVNALDVSGGSNSRVWIIWGGVMLLLAGFVLYRMKSRKASRPIY